MSTILSKKSYEPWRDPSSVPYIEIIDLVKVFDEYIAVNNVSLDVYKGEFFRY